VCLRATFFFTIISAVHYVFLVQHRLRAHPQLAAHISQRNTVNH
jgi:hypothetical protein